MPLNTETFEADIVINSKQALNELKKLKEMRDNEIKSQEALYRTGKKEDRELAAQKQKNIEHYNKMIREQEKYIKGLSRSVNKLSNSSYKELSEIYRALNKELRSGNVKRNSKEWNELTQKIRACRTEMKKIESATQAQTSAWQRLSKFLNDSWGGLTLVIGSLTGLSMTVRKAVQDFADMEEAMADTRKYTGLTEEQVRDLNEEFKKMDTRTSREELNELAGVAGRLGKTSKEDIMDFVEAGNMIKVALGDDLGEGAIDKIGKLAMAFGEDDKKGLRGAMLATGSAVNELAQNSAAKAGYLVDFTARVGAFGRQLGLTQAQLMGFAAVMDEGMLRDEMAATAFGNMLTRMRTDTEKFAKIAGMDIKEFARLLDEDANAALLRLADNMKRQDAQTMMKMLDDMGLDGSRAVAVISTLADKIDDVRRHQQLATKAYDEATSVVQEYTVMNATAQAELDKAKKAFHELTVELGERLKPVVTYTISAGGMMARTINGLISFTSEHARTLTILISTITVLTAVLKANTIAQTINTRATQLQTIAEKALNGVMEIRKGLLGTLRVLMLAHKKVLAEYRNEQQRTIVLTRALNIAMASTPWGAVLAGTIALIGGLAMLSEEISKVADNTRRMKEAISDANVLVSEEKQRIEDLVKVINSAVSSEHDRKVALEELNGKLMQKHLGNITEEEIRQGKANKKLEEYLELRRKEITLAALEDQMKESIKSEQEAKDWFERISSGNLKWYEVLGKNTVDFFTPANNIAGLFDSDLNAFNLLVRMKSELDQRFERNNQKRLQQKIDELVGTRNPFDNGESMKHDIFKPNDHNGTADNTYVSDADRKKQEQERKKAELEERKREQEEKKRLRERNQAVKAAADELRAINLAEYSAGQRDYRQYVERIKEIALLEVSERKKIYKEGSAEYNRLLLEEQKIKKHGSEEQQKMELRDMEAEHRAVIDELKTDYADRNSFIYQNEAALNEAIFQADYDLLEKKKELYTKGSLEYMEVDEEMQELLHQHQREKEIYFQESLESLRENYLGQSADKRLTMELNALEELHRLQLVSEDEYQQARLAIQARYAKDPVAQNQEKFRQRASDAFSLAKQNAGDVNTTNAWTGDITNLAERFKYLKQLRDEDKIDHDEYLAAKAMAVEEFLQATQEKYGVVFEQIGNLYNAANAYAKASSDYEVAMVTKKYDAEIEKAGNNQKKVKKLEEKKQKEIAKIKTKANERAMRIEIAAALASTAVGAINAYTSAAQTPIIGHIIAPIAAAAAIAAGMLQVATIKKQHQAEAAGYYEGGYTGGRRYRREAGVVHEGEFVANHEAVNNPAVTPFLDFIDRAQRNNTVGSLTMDDVRRAMGGGQTQVVAPVVNVQTDNEELREVLDANREANEQLAEQLKKPIKSYVVLTGPDGLNAQQERLDSMLKNK